MALDAGQGRRGTHPGISRSGNALTFWVPADSSPHLDDDVVVHSP